MKNSSNGFNLRGSEVENQGEQGEKIEHLEEEEKGGGVGERARCHWDFTLCTVVSSSSTDGAGTDTIGIIEFDPSDNLVVTGGIARKIRVYSVNSLLPGENPSHDERNITWLQHNDASNYYICTPAKLSSLRWKPGSAGRVLGSGDYDGVVTEYDLDHKIPIFERDEHGGRRIWSVDYSHWDPFVGASGSDDGTLQMWDPRCEGIKNVAKVRPSVGGSAVCCVEFNPFGGPLVAAGCADRRAYGYDVRKMTDPVLIFAGHQKTVTYVRFPDERTMVTSGTDGFIRLWSVDDARMIRVYMGHTNSRSFVGLSVWRAGGLLACGSENNHVYVYDRRWGEAIWVHGFGGGSSGDGCGPNFVSSVCWRQKGEDGCTLVAGGSDGILQVIAGKRRDEEHFDVAKERNPS